ncbi:MAG: HRDC domain-containing protein [Desulfatitalea sp.]|nr:HRDC domain-containing protein [Desulfatitalea sp.]
MGQEKKSEYPAPPQYELIETAAALDAFARAAVGAGSLAVDVEADSMFHYQERVCLIQMAANGHTVVIDPLRVTDLERLKPLFADPGIRKVFHGADYDVRSLYRDFGITIDNLFDTQLASMYLGHAETSLEAVVAHRFGVELDKKYQKKDWSRRPLPPEMVAYAACDVIYLIPLADALTRELGEKGRLAWVQESCRLLSQVRPQENYPPLFLKFRGAGRLAPRQLAALEALLQLRDQQARQKDRPWFKIMGNATLLKIATEMPASLKRLKAGKALSPRQLEMYGQAIMAALDEARQLPDDALPVYPHRKSPRLSARIPRRIKALREWRDQVADALILDPALLFNKALLQEIAVHKPRTIEELARIPQMHQWQVETFGEEIVEVLDRVP